MLRIYDNALHIVAAAAHVANDIAHHDADLARQLRRAATSIALNIAEGAGVVGRNRRVRYGTALGSTYEVRACVDAGRLLGYSAGFDTTATEHLERVAGTLFKLTR